MRNAPLSFQCPRCGGISHHLEDIRQRYCTCCGSADGLLPKRCGHTRPDALEGLEVVRVSKAEFDVYVAAELRRSPYGQLALEVLLYGAPRRWGGKDYIVELESSC